MDRNEMKKIIKDYIVNSNGVTFVEIEDLFTKHDFNYKGDLAKGLSYYNIVFWTGWNYQAYSIIDELVNEKSVDIMPTEPTTYFVDGKMLPYEYAKTLRQYKKNRWFPLIFNKYKE